MLGCIQLDDLHLVNYRSDCHDDETINKVLTFSTSISITGIKYCSLSYCVICDTVLKLLLRNQLTLSALIAPYGTNGMGTFSF